MFILNTCRTRGTHTGRMGKGARRSIVPDKERGSFLVVWPNCIGRFVCSDSDFHADQSISKSYSLMLRAGKEATSVRNLL